MSSPRTDPRTTAAGPRVAAVGVLILLLWSVVLLEPVWGHAGGMPTHAKLSAEGEVVHVELVSAPDDAALMGSTLGLLPDGAMEVYLGASDDELPSDAEIRAFSASPELREYLLEHVEVHQDGRRCDGDAAPAEDFVMDGAELRFTCPEPVEQATISITLLHDQDPAYRAYTVDGTIQSYTHTAAQPEHEWDFTLAAASDPGVPTALWGGLALVGLAAVGLLRRFRTRATGGARR